MDDSLYDDKLSGDITQEKYKEKHEQFVSQTTELNEKLSQLDSSLGKRLEHKLVLLELFQKVAQIYPSKSSEQKRLIVSKPFEDMTIKEGVPSVKYTKFAIAIDENVSETLKVMEATKMTIKTTKNDPDNRGRDELKAQLRSLGLEIGFRNITLTLLSDDIKEMRELFKNRDDSSSRILAATVWWLARRNRIYRYDNH